MPATDPAALLAAARAWAAEDPDPASARGLAALAARAEAGDGGALADLADRFAGPLEFGTAGLRAPLGAGPARMNRAVVRRTAAGLAAHLLAAADGRYAPRAAVGYDARHGSAAFARDTAAVLTAAGIETLLLPGALPTPVLAWAVREFACEAGVMVTASHNPPTDNGYKVYLGGRAVEGPGQGAQIVAPLDRDIAARIDHAAPLASIPLAGSGWRTLPGPGEPGDVRARYAAAAAAVADPGRFPARGLRIVHTSLHGVGGDTAALALSLAGFRDVVPVPEQARPDPDFPTVAFPNPEEPGAMDLALSLAERAGADLVLANDPDADRCAVAIPDGGRWRTLGGDETGALLGAHLARRSAARGRAPGVFANSVVSSRMLARIAAAAGVPHATTLTGFKWISRVPGLSYGYEEALGYCVAPDLVRDKDGITAAVLVAELAADLLAAGRTVAGELDRLALEHGVHATDQLSVRVAALPERDAMLSRLRADPPARLAGSPVAVAADLAAGHAGLPPTEGLLFEAADGTRAIVRPSGTEPKLKCYLEAVVPVAAPGGLPAARAEAAARLAAARAGIAGRLGLPG